MIAKIEAIAPSGNAKPEEQRINIPIFSELFEGDPDKAIDYGATTLRISLGHALDIELEIVNGKIVGVKIEDLGEKRTINVDMDSYFSI